MEAEVYYLYHSGVAVKFNNQLLVFDYYRDYSESKENGLEGGVVTPQVIEAVDRVYVFVSHNHHDHFNPVIFEWQDYNPEVYYILSDDIRSSAGVNNKYFMKSDSNIVIGELEIETKGSTDQGVSFLVKGLGLTIFHSGDLNWWHWKSFSDEEQKREEIDYKQEIKKIINLDIDIAFVPVDPRLEEYYCLAGEYFINKVKPKLFIPIHTFGDHNITKKFKERMKNSRTEIARIDKRGMKIDYDLGK